MNKLLLISTIVFSSIAINTMAMSQNDHDFFEAIEKGQLAIVKTMLERGASSNAINRHKESALHCAVKLGYSGIVDALLAAKANPNFKDGIYEETSLTLAAAAPYDDPTIVSKLLNAGAYPNIPNGDNKVPFVVACKHYNIKIANRLRPVTYQASVDKGLALYNDRERE